MARRVFGPPFLAGAAILLAVVVAYLNGLSGPFVFDDVPSVRDNPTIRDWRAVGQVLSPPERTTVAGRPLVNASLALSHALSGDATWGYHVVNVAIHGAAALALFGLVRRTLLRPALRERFGADALPLAGVVAVLWAVHPVQTESVTYIVQRAESLMGLCYLLTLYCFVRALGSTRSGAWQVASVVACALGMATKEVMVSAPLLVLLYDRCLAAENFRAAWRERAWTHGALATTWLLLAALVAHTGGNRGGSIGFGVGIGWGAHALTQFPAIVRYLALSFWPHPLVFEYEPEWVERAADVIPAALLTVTLLAAAAAGVWRNRIAGVAGALIFAVLAPTSLLPAPTQLVVEHRLYLPLAALVALLVPWAYAGLGRRGLAALLAAALAFGALTIRRNADYRSEIALWADTVAKRPRNGFAHASLGHALSQAGRLDEAIAHEQEAVRLTPDRALLHYNLALVLARSGRNAEALDEYAQAVRVEPGYADAHNNYAVALAHAGRAQEALREFAATLRLRPADAEAHYNLGALLSQLGRGPEAIAEFAAALQLRPTYAAALVEWGTTLAAMGRLDDALARYEQAVRLEPRDPVARNKAGLVLLATGRVPEAIRYFEAALQVAPGDPAARANLAMARTRLKN